MAAAALLAAGAFSPAVSARAILLLGGGSEGERQPHSE